ncbi:MAG: phenylalanine--tRNA ligase subunit beta [Rikenellaceae bacterium]|jgi:phenylalanyl-tRNA synthetase beta chain|nr:phenylalanine--tRNA ligase subunit beta [Rikenellaceae bacterium]
MKVSYNWLKNYLTSGLSAPEMAEILTDIGLEVDSLERLETVRGGLEGVVVGEVLTCTDHPDSDHLHVTTVDIGTGDAQQIVCGAPNVAAGQKVLVVTVGSTLYPTGSEEGLKIKRSKIRGVESLGMICAEDELGIGTAHEGIMVLAPDAVVGTPAKEHLNIEEDWMIEIGLTPNRVDAASHYGVARDVAAYLRAHNEPAELTRPSVEDFKEDNHSLEIPVEVLEPIGAPRYAGVTITNLKIGPSPEWMQNSLRTIGLNPHNNLVDITNFVLHELGQPLHAFDADKIAGGKVVVQTCPEGTKFVTLDGVERTLSAEDLMICDAEKPMCIAGVMGGEWSGVSDSTTRIFLESAYFNPVWIRKSAKRHGINSDASFRFERGIDPNQTVYALRRAALLYKELAGGEISSDVVDIYPEPMTPFRFEFSLSRANRLIGKEIPREEVLQILAALDVAVEADRGDVLDVAVPPYRVDVQREADLVEDVLRIYGYNNVEIPQHLHTSLNVAPKPDKDSLQNTASDFLTAGGFTEIMSNSLTRSGYYDGLSSYPVEACVRILNPLSVELNVMRQTLLFNALEAVRLNTNHRNSDLRLYEFGNCYFYDAAKKGTDNSLAPYKETYRLGITVTGAEVHQSWNAAARPSSFYTLSGVVEQLVRRFGFDLYRMQVAPLESDLFSEALTYKLAGKELFQIGVVVPAITKQFDLKAPVYFLEMDFGHLVRSTAKNRVQATELSKFPVVRRDLALLVDSDVTFRRLREIAFATEKKLLTSVGLFDVYEGDKLPAGKKSYALSFTLEDPTQTLTDKVIDKVMSNLISQFERLAGATVRA